MHCQRGHVPVAADAARVAPGLSPGPQFRLSAPQQQAADRVVATGVEGHPHNVSHGLGEAARGIALSVLRPSDADRAKAYRATNTGANAR